MSHLTDTAFLQKQLDAMHQGRDIAVATIVEADGSTPRSAAKMIVFRDGGIHGTIGGGAVERLVIADAVKALERGENAFMSYDLTGEDSDTGMTCGGKMRVMIEVFPARPQLVIFGAGHVGEALMRIAKTVGFFITLVDDRPAEGLKERIALADEFFPTDDYTGFIKEHTFHPDAYYTIMTHGHVHDLEALEGVMSKEDAAYVGMIGSASKVEGIFAKLTAKGIPREKLDAVYTPIGLDLGGQTPAEIAISIMAEIQAVRHGKNGQHMREYQKQYRK